MSTTDTKLALTNPRYATAITRLATFSRSSFRTKLYTANAKKSPRAATSTAEPASSSAADSASSSSSSASSAARSSSDSGGGSAGAGWAAADGAMPSTKSSTAAATITRGEPQVMETLEGCRCRAERRADGMRGRRAPILSDPPRPEPTRTDRALVNRRGGTASLAGLPAGAHRSAVAGAAEAAERPSRGVARQDEHLPGGRTGDRGGRASFGRRATAAGPSGVPWRPAAARSAGQRRGHHGWHAACFTYGPWNR